MTLCTYTIVYHQLVIPCGPKNFEYDISTLTRENVQSERCIKQIHCSDWTILRYECEDRTQKLYGSKSNSYVYEILEYKFCTLI